MFEAVSYRLDDLYLVTSSSVHLFTVIGTQSMLKLSMNESLFYLPHVPNVHFFLPQSRNLSIIDSSLDQRGKKLYTQVIIEAEVM